MVADAWWPVSRSLALDTAGAQGVGRGSPSASRMHTGTWRSFDFVLLIVTMLLMAIGVTVIHSATAFSFLEGEFQWEEPVVRQLSYGVVGLVLMVMFAVIDYRFWKRVNWLVYGVMLFLLVLLFIVGRESFGARSWLDLVLFPLQPSELSKVALILVLARYLSGHSEGIERFRHIPITLALALPPIGLVYLQPDLGTALVMVAIWAGMIFAAGTRISNLLLIGLAGGLATPVVWSSVKPYMRERITAFLNPSRDLAGASYNTRQAVIGIGSGGLWGKGFGQGTQSQLQFLRVRHTDYVFSVLAEEMGLVGSLLLLALLALLLLRILRVARMSRDSYGRLIACGVAAMVFFQGFVNIGMNVNLLPVTGLPLPLVSYGGSSLLNTLIALGLVESAAIRHREVGFSA